MAVQGGVHQWCFRWVFGSWSLLGAKMVPRAPKKPQEAPKTASKTDFGAILVVDFLMVFWLVWGFTSALVVCCGVGLLLCWFVGLLVCWLVALLVFWFVTCLLVGCLAPRSKARWPRGPWAVACTDRSMSEAGRVQDHQPNPPRPRSKSWSLR